MNRYLTNRLLVSGLLSGISLLNMSNFASAQSDPSRIYQRQSTDSENPCEYILEGMDVLGSDFYDRMSAYQSCASQWINSLPNQSQQSYPQNYQPSYRPMNDQIYNHQQELMQQIYEMKS